MIGTSLSHYRIVDKLGAGGMGEVYRAEDTVLGRQVAIKVLPDIFAADPERLARFEREAKLLASLNHPNIASIYGLEEADGKRFLVLELVEGQTLAERLHKGPLPVEEALEVCRQIAEGLEAAHEKGVIHRDLKPANVKVTPEGKVKVLDFGLARALHDQTSKPDLSHSPTITDEMTRPGVVLGTAAYMSPEQAKGKTVDKRADIWAFGCVLYECLTARRTFQGDTITETVAAILKSEPDWTLLASETPSFVRSLLRRCLQKEPNLRLHDIADARIEIEEARAALSQGVLVPAEPAVGASRKLFWRQVVQWTVVCTVGLTALCSLLIWYLTAPEIPTRVIPSVRFAMPITLVERRPVNPMLALSPDGIGLVYAAERAGKRQLFLRAMDQLNAVPLDGTESASGVFFSPDGRWIGFFADGRMRRMAITGGASTVICAAPGGQGASWGADDTIVFAPRFASALLSVPATGGAPKSVTTLNAARGEVCHLWPQILPGGKAMILTIGPGDIASYDDAHIVAQVIGEAEPRILIRGGTFARYATTGHLVYARNGTLLAVPFDLSRLQVNGPPTKVLDDLLTIHDSGAAQYALSETGTLAYISGGAYKPDGSLVAVDRRGVARPLLPDRAAYTDPAFSPDGQVALCITAANDDIWLFDPRRPVLNRFTLGRGDNQHPVWTPDGNRIVFTWGRTGPKNLFWKAADGGGETEQLLTSENHQYPHSISPDGNFLAYWEDNPSTRGDIWLLPLRGQRKPQPFMVTSFDEWAPKFSPNGRWIAYTSNESGRAEIYVKVVQGTAGKRQVSIAGGMWPVWSQKTGELFFLNGSTLMASKVDPGSGVPGSLESLFEMRNLPQISHHPPYDVAPDGRSFIMTAQDEQQPARELRLVLNWFEELKRLVPTGNK